MKTQFEAHYPELLTEEAPLLAPETLDTIARAYEDASAHLETETTRRTATYKLGDKAIRAFVDLPQTKQVSETIVIPRYFGGGLGPDAAWLTQTLRASGVENEAIVILPNSTRDQDNLALDDQERLQLTNGDISPYTQRLEAILTANNLDETALHFLGASQGSLTSTAMAQQLAGRTRSLTLLDPPELAGNSTARNALNLIKSMKHYETNQRLLDGNFDVPLDTELLQGKRSGSIAENKDLMAMNGFMNVRDNELAIAAIARQRDIPVTIGYGAHSLLTSEDGIQKLSEAAGMYATTVRFNGDYADHSIAMQPIIAGALLTHSLQLAKLIGRDSLVA